MESSQASFNAAASGLRAKRRSLSKNIGDYIRSLKEDGLPTLESFVAKRTQFESEWDECVRANQNCISLANSGDEEEMKKAEDLSENLEAVRYQKEMLEYFENDIRKKSAERLELKNVVSHENALSPIHESDEDSSSSAEGKVSVADNVTVEADTSDVEGNPVFSGIKLEEMNASETREESSVLLSAIENLGKSFYVQLNESSARTDVNINHLSDNVHNVHDNMNSLRDNVDAGMNALRGDVDAGMNALHVNMNALEQSNQSINRCVTQLSDDISIIQGKVSGIQGDVLDLRTDNVEIRKEFESNSLETEKKNKNLNKAYRWS